METVDKNKPLYYLLWVFLLSIPFYFLNLLHPGGILIDLPISFLMIFVPSGLALFFTYRDQGPKALKDLVIDSHRLRPGSLKWLVLSILIMPLAFTLAAYLNKPYNFNIFAPLNIKHLGLLVLLYLGAILEELGWTTYLTKPMQTTYGVLRAGLIIGLFWGLWHLFPYLSQGKSWHDIVFLIGLSVLYRVIMGYLYQASLYTSLTGILFHTMINFVPETMIGVYNRFNFSTLFLILLVLVIGLRLIYKEK